jgi:3-deoxy-D-manno-octulosonic-acid transferase
MTLWRSLGWTAYQAALLASLPLAAPFLVRKRGFAHYGATLRGRLARDLPPPPAGGRPLWLHAVSVGEAGVAATLARQLPPALPLLVTTVTPTGQEHARKLFAERLAAGTATVAYLPFDLGFAVDRFLATYRPSQLILTEGDYWPRLLAACRERGVPVAVINGRLSDRAFKRQLKLRRLNDLFYGGIEVFAVQTDDDRRRLIGLGVDAERVRVMGNLKFDAPPLTPLAALEIRLRELAAGRPLVVAGSTMEGEEAALVAAMARVGFERALLLLAPRHPERWEGVDKLVRSHGLKVVRRSALGKNAELGVGPTRPDVVLLDSLGELAALYNVATVAFVGGTLAPTGGHNPLEPARFAKPIVVGPSMHNFRDMAERFDLADAWLRVDDAAALGQALVELLTDPRLADALGRRAGDLLTRNRGAVERTVALLAPQIERALKVAADSGSETATGP